MANTRFETVSIGNVQVHVCSSTKFKTTTFVAYIGQELNADTVTKTALLPAVLQRGTQSTPSTIELKRKLDDLYGAILFGDVFKRGERHLMEFGLEIANEQYLQDKPALLEEGLSFLTEVLFAPVTEGNGFKASYVEAEKKNLKQKIESLQDDKIRYAAQRMVEEMCKNEPFALFNHGRLEDLEQIEPTRLYTYYQEVMNTCPIDLYCVGNVSIDQVVRLLSDRLAPYATGKRKEIPLASVTHEVKEEKVVVDRLNVKQGKLNIGCRTQTEITSDDYPALVVYNGILGGFPHSKLFRNVREKASLAYYCSSRLESYKGLLMIQSGIEIANYQQAVDIIKEQLEAMRQGQIETQELEQTKATLANSYKEQQDRSYDLINFHYQSVLVGRERTLEQMLEAIERVSKDDIVRVAQKVQLDTIYFLRDQEGNADAKN
ncbi:EF-P 5-aminopentanol modification-associated protein YfmF [Laceyella putida]|uniref:EF-P 5-aminopentanol modification-associated protein YfmF n=1 Tax=Laceyella putida TaxID=110101 RepID=A0ABW2RKI7_9BACL